MKGRTEGYDRGVDKGAAGALTRQMEAARRAKGEAEAKRRAEIRAAVDAVCEGRPAKKTIDSAEDIAKSIRARFPDMKVSRDAVLKCLRSR